MRSISTFLVIGVLCCMVLAVYGSVLTSGVTEATYNGGLNELAVPSSLQGLTVTALPNSLRVSWSNPNPESKTLVGGYIVGWGKGITDEYQRFVNANTHNYTIDNLDPSSEYVITVRAFNSYGIGQPIYKTATTSAEAYDFTQNVRCNFKVYRNTSVIYNGLVSSSNTYTMEECRRVCEDSSSGFEECVAFRYGRNAGGECSLYFDRNGIRKMVPQSGFDYYDKTCGQYTTTQIMPLMPPVAVKCIVLSPSSVLLTWSDTSLGTNQVVQDNRFYAVRYRATSNAGEYRFLNSSEPNAHIDSLQPNTRYEFEVKVQKGDRTSTWSVNAVNTTMEAVPGSAPRNLTLIPKVNDPSAVTVIWLPPSKPNGQITGYLVYYTTDATHDVRDWVYQGVLGEELTTTIKHLTPNTTYYIKIQARNRKGYGPGSQTYVYKSPKNYLTPNVDCNYTEYRDTTVKYNGMMSSSNTYTMEECRRECDDSGFEECVAFLYGRTSGGECSLYYDRNGIQEMVSRSGFDFYVKTCGQLPQKPEVTSASLASEDPVVKMPSAVPRGVEVTSASVAQFTCSANQFTCANGKCIPKAWTCDGDRDCEDNSDETNCASEDPAVKMPSAVPREVEVTSASVAQFTCSANQFTCTNGKCIPKAWTCDGDRDCEDNSDETNCAQLTCNADQFTCTNGKCIPKRWICDGDRDCEDNSDETNCEPLTCGPNMFRCDNDSKCKDNSWKCDGDFDCIDHSDEMNCTTANVTHRCRGTEWECKSGEQCIHGSWKCDGEADCPDGSDEENCTFTCKPDQFQCAGKSCIHASLRCDGSLDCTDGSDETNCTVHPIACKAEEFDCFNNGSSCIAVSSVCNGSMECPNGADENMNICGNNPCNMNNGGCVHTCIPSPNQKHRCECLPGFRLVGNSSCGDIDECLEDKHVCSQICTNTNGSYICSCVSGYEMKRQSGHQYCKVIGERPSLIFANRHDIRELKLDSMQVARLVEGLRSAISVDYDFKNKMMYWSDSYSLTLRRAPISHNITPEMQETIVSDNIKVPDGIAVDWIYGNIYWTDTGFNRIEVAKQDGTMRKTLIDSDIDEPRAIAVDPNEGWLFFSDWGFHPKIERVAMDGDASTREIIVKDDILWPNGLTIDYLEKRVYWVDAKVHKVSSVDYDGKRLRNILQNDNQVQSPFAVAVFEDDIFWTDWASDSIKTINKISGKDYRQLATGISSPMDIHVYHEKVQISGMNHCGQYNGQCSHLCLPIPTVNAKGKRYSCACPNGFDLGGDGFKCIQVGVSGSVSEPQIS